MGDVVDVSVVMLMATERFLSFWTSSFCGQKSSAMNEPRVLPLARTYAGHFVVSGAYTEGEPDIEVTERVDGRIKVASENPEPVQERRHLGIGVVLARPFKHAGDEAICR